MTGVPESAGKSLSATRKWCVVSYRWIAPIRPPSSASFLANWRRFSSRGQFEIDWLRRCQKWNEIVFNVEFGYGSLKGTWYSSNCPSYQNYCLRRSVRPFSVGCSSVRDWKKKTPRPICISIDIEVSLSFPSLLLAGLFLFALRPSIYDNVTHTRSIHYHRKRSKLH